MQLGQWMELISAVALLQLIAIHSAIAKVVYLKIALPVSHFQCGSSTSSVDGKDLQQMQQCIHIPVLPILRFPKENSI
jgi:hypothetical protein